MRQERNFRYRLLWHFMCVWIFQISENFISTREARHSKECFRWSMPFVSTTLWGIILVHLDCYNKNRLGELNNKHLFLTVLEAGKSKIKELPDLVSGESWLPGSWTAMFSLCPCMMEGARELSGASFTRVLVPFMRTPPSWPNYLPKTPSPNTTTFGFRFQHMDLGRTQTFRLQQGDTNITFIL